MHCIHVVKCSRLVLCSNYFCKINFLLLLIVLSHFGVVFAFQLQTVLCLHLKMSYGIGWVPGWENIGKSSWQRYLIFFSHNFFFICLLNLFLSSVFDEWQWSPKTVLLLSEYWLTKPMSPETVRFLSGYWLTKFTCSRTDCHFIFFSFTIYIRI